ncbi:MAG: V-type ATP synthase subunit B [Synergistaceae bacterium]|jgi:V/A-type H+-transporting ATPase subunit B|nr:V-type ATP synthase subunit B [Synergistaceae bacterium]
MNTARLYKEGSSEIEGLAGPLLFVSDMRGAACGERVTVETDGRFREGQVLSVRDDLCVVLLFEGTEGLSTGRTTVWLERDAVKTGVGEILRGQVLSGRGLPLDGGDLYGAEDFLPVEGLPLNPAVRAVPTAAVETGLSALDVAAPLMLGQKFSLFAPPGLPGLETAARIAGSALIRSGRSLVSGKERTPLVIFVGMGLAEREEDCFLEFFNREDDAAGGVFLLNRAGDPIGERLLIPRVALTVAEHFAFRKGLDVLVVMADMFRYAQAFWETTAFGDRRRFDLGSDLAGLCGRSGCLAGRPGSVTQLLVAETPADHPFAELLGRLTEGRIVLDRRLHVRGISPPIDVLESRFRISAKAVGRGRTIDAHEALAARLRSAYAEAREAAGLYREFTESFEKIFLDQKARRTFAQSEAAAWEVLNLLPSSEFL